MFGPKKIFSPKKILGPKKIFGPKKFFGRKKFLVKKIFFWSAWIQNLRVGHIWFYNPLLDSKSKKNPGAGWVLAGWVGQIRFYNPLWLSSELSFDSESKFEPSVAIWSLPKLIPPQVDPFV